MILEMALSNPETQKITGKSTSTSTTTTTMAEVECVTCFCCGFTEECTPDYICRVRDRYNGRWICGLCIEAVKDEVVRSGEVVISVEEALERHVGFCNEFRVRALSDDLDETEHPIFAMGRLLRRSLDSPPGAGVFRSNSTGDIRIRDKRLQRSESCFPSLST